MQDADGRTTRMEHDDLGRLFRTTRDPGGLDLTSTTTQFDADSHPERIEEANGEVTIQTWDELGRLSVRTHQAPASGWTAPWAYTTEARNFYDPNSNLERVEEHDLRTDGGTPPLRVTARTYDLLDRETSESVTHQDATTSAVVTEYFRDGQVKSETDPRGTTSYTYDGQGRQETMTTSGAVTRKSYYPDSLVKDITFANGTKRTFGYDKADRLLTIATVKGEVAVAETAYTLDANGNRLTQVQTNGGSAETTSYTYDDLDRLATITYPADGEHANGRTVTYGHDKAGNRTSEQVTDPVTQAVFESKAGIFDTANRLTTLTDNLDASQTTTLVWDKNGNLVSETKAGVTTSYRYDLRDTLAEVQRGEQTFARFLGDFDERRVLKIGDPTRPGGSGVQEYLYHGSRLVGEIENAQQVSRYEWTNEELVSLVQPNGTRRYFALDGLETVLALTDEAGEATDRLSFDAWGVPKEGTDFGTSGSRFAYASHRFDTELQMYYAGGRMYSPTIGRFISQDTLSLAPNNPDTWNLFSYARGNPTRYVDPTGHAALGVAARRAKEERAARGETSGSTYTTDQAGNVVIADSTARVNRPGPETAAEQQARWDKSAEFRAHQASTESTTVTEDAGIGSTGEPAIDTEVKRRRDTLAACRKVGEVGTAVGKTALEIGAGDLGDVTAAATGTTVAGDKLTTKQRVVAGVLVVVPILAASHIRSLGKLADAAEDIPGGAAGEARTYVTYELKNAKGEVVYVGRASGIGTPEQVMKDRLAKGHDVFDANPGLTPAVSAAQGTSAANKGAEGVLYEQRLKEGAQLLNDPKSPPLSAKPSKAAAVRRKIDAYHEDLKSP
jgi:RHS repeat-associated protein